MNFSPVAILNQQQQSIEKSATFIGYTGFTLDAVTYSVDIPAGLGNLIVGMHWEASTSRTITSFTNNGTSGTILKVNGISNTVAAMATVPSSNSGTNTISVTFNNSVLRFGISLWRLVNFTQIPIVDSEFGGTSTGGNTASNVFGGYQANDVGITIVSNINANANINYTNATSFYSENLEANMSVSGGKFNIIDGNNYTMSVNWSLSGANAFTGFIFR
jgi:hypothetical protein